MLGVAVMGYNVCWFLYERLFLYRGGLLLFFPFCLTVCGLILALGSPVPQQPLTISGELSAIWSTSPLPELPTFFFFFFTADHFLAFYCRPHKPVLF